MNNKGSRPNCTDLLASLLVCAFIGLKQQIIDLFSGYKVQMI